MRIVLLAAISCMIIGSVSGMEQKAEEQPAGLFMVTGFMSGSLAGHAIVQASHERYDSKHIVAGGVAPFIAVLFHKQMNMKQKIALGVGWGLGALTGASISTQALREFCGEDVIN